MCLIISEWLIFLNTLCVVHVLTNIAIIRQYCSKLQCQRTFLVPILIYYYSCCEAKSHKIPTCSDPSAESSYPNDEIFCPAPPVLSITDRASATSPVGHLDDINTYVAEKLLQYIDEVNIGIFESLFQVRKWTLFCHFFE